MDYKNDELSDPSDTVCIYNISVQQNSLKIRTKTKTNSTLIFKLDCRMLKQNELHGSLTVKLF